MALSAKELAKIHKYATRIKAFASDCGIQGDGRDSDSLDYSRGHETGKLPVVMNQTANQEESKYESNRKQTDIRDFSK